MHKKYIVIILLLTALLSYLFYVNKQNAKMVSDIPNSQWQETDLNIKPTGSIDQSLYNETEISDTLIPSEEVAQNNILPDVIKKTLPANSIEQTNIPVKTDVISQDKKIRFGAYVGYSDNDLKLFEELVGVEVDMRGVFVNWNDPFPLTFGALLKTEGKAMVIYWEQYGVSLDDIIAAKSDEYIKKFAADALAYGGEIILSPLHEMNGNWDPWGGSVGNNSPEKVIQTWQKIFNEFGDVPNVKFAWTVNNISVPNTPENSIEKYYPGDEYVDYVAVDGFNFSDPWQNFESVFAGALQTLKKYQKPIYILSIASAEGDGKAEWIRDMFFEQLPKHPQVLGFVWFHVNKERDWRVNSDEKSLKAFSEAVQ